MQGNLLQRASLRNRDGSVWPVKVARIQNDFFFLDGWAKYVADNAVTKGDILVFHYDGSSVYDMMIFAPNMCERKRFAALIPKKEENEEGNKPVSKIKEEEDREEKREETERDENHLGAQFVRPKEELNEEENEPIGKVKEEEEEDQEEKREETEGDENRMDAQWVGPKEEDAEEEDKETDEAEEDEDETYTNATEMDTYSYYVPEEEKK